MRPQLFEVHPWRYQEKVPHRLDSEQCNAESNSSTAPPASFVNCSRTPGALLTRSRSSLTRTGRLARSPFAFSTRTDARFVPRSGARPKGRTPAPEMGFPPRLAAPFGQLRQAA